MNISFPEEIEEIAWMESQLAEKYIHIPIELEGLIQRKESVPYIFRGIVHKS